MSTLAELRSAFHASMDGKVPLIPLIERTWLMAAENGFPDVSEHRLNHYDRAKFQKKMTNPLHLIATAIYLAKRNLVTTEKKLQFINSHKLSYEEVMQVWALFWRKRNEEESIPINYPIQENHES